MSGSGHDKAAIEKRLLNLAAQGRRLNDSYRMTSRGTLESRTPEAQFRSFATTALAEIDRLVGKNSTYYTAIPLEPLTQQLAVVGYSNTFVPAVLGTLDALRIAVAGGLLSSLETAHRQSVHADFLQQARQLLDTGYHVAAMVLAGGVLEEQLLKLCVNRNLSWAGDGSLSKYIAALYSAAVVDKTTQSRLQSAAHCRNDAAHGKGAQVKASDVEDHWAYIGRFVADHPS